MGFEPTCEIKTSAPNANAMLHRNADKLPMYCTNAPAKRGAKTAHACQTIVVHVAALTADSLGTIWASKLGMVGSANPRATPKKNMQKKIAMSIDEPVRSDATAIPQADSN